MVLLRVEGALMMVVQGWKKKEEARRPWVWKVKVKTLIGESVFRDRTCALSCCIEGQEEVKMGHQTRSISMGTERARKGAFLIMLSPLE